MNVYDFDKTIYKNDSNTDFYLWVLKKQPGLIRYWPRQFLALAAMGLHIWPLHRAKERFMSYFALLEDPEGMIKAFWDEHIDKVNAYYPKIHQDDDVVISASPDCIVREGCRRLGIKNVIATDMDMKTGRFLSQNCKGAQKVKVFRSFYPDAKVEQFYSDSFSDTPMAEIAEKAFLIKKGIPGPWPEK